MPTLTRFSYRIPPEIDSEGGSFTAGAHTGRLVRIDGEGRLFVEFDGNSGVPVAARLALADTELADVLEGAELLLVFEGNNPTKPIIIGKVRDRLPDDGIEIRIRGRRIKIDSDGEIELRCGDAKVRITRDGDVIVLGNDILSRARRRNRIKGGTVNIN